MSLISDFVSRFLRMFAENAIFPRWLLGEKPYGKIYVASAQIACRRLSSGVLKPFPDTKSDDDVARKNSHYI